MRQWALCKELTCECNNTNDICNSGLPKMQGKGGHGRYKWSGTLASCFLCVPAHDSNRRCHHTATATASPLVCNKTLAQPRCHMLLQPAVGAPACYSRCCQSASANVQHVRCRRLYMWTAHGRGRVLGARHAAMLQEITESLSPLQAAGQVIAGKLGCQATTGMEVLTTVLV